MKDILKDAFLVTCIGAVLKVISIPLGFEVVVLTALGFLLYKFFNTK